MHKNLSLPTLSLIISCSLIFTGCSDNKNEINRQNSQLITGLIFWGPIKSVKSTFNTTSDSDEQKRSAEGNMSIQYTSDGELTSYHYDSVVYMGQNESTFFSKMVMKSSFDKSTLLSKKMSSTFYDKNDIENLIITTDFYYSANEESKQINNIRTISNKHSPKTNIQHVFWENNRVDRVSGQDFQGLKTSIKYNYNKQGNLAATIDSEENKNKTSFSTIKKIEYHYDNDGFFSKAVAQFYGKKLNSEYTYLDITSCLENDIHGNCLIAEMSKFSPEGLLEFKTTHKYEYQYY
ncbi:hypothetical protein [Providencia rettgeri]|uniref:hypothetical protein n=1 Tax=Providencia rettgeri TaxID=587 RepID=UPI001B363F80|nr:hypothetical protein [Providencia rettgeri]MBQ0366843.1 hypothetical protein [Providencia rettgeri]